MEAVAADDVVAVVAEQCLGRVEVVVPVALVDMDAGFASVERR